MSLRTGPAAFAFPTETEIYILPDRRVVTAGAVTLAGMLGPTEPCETAPPPEKAPEHNQPALLTIELYSDGEPSRHTLFVMAKGLPPPLGEGDELHNADPPEDAATRFTPYAHGCHPDRRCRRRLGNPVGWDRARAHRRPPARYLCPTGSHGRAHSGSGHPLRRLFGSDQMGTTCGPRQRRQRGTGYAAPAGAQCATGVQLFIPHGR